MSDRQYIEQLDVHWVDEGPYRRFTYRDVTGTIYVDVIWCGNQTPDQRQNVPPLVRAAV